MFFEYKNFKLFIVILFLFVLLIKMFYLNPKKADEIILLKIKDSLNESSYKISCGYFLGLFVEYEKAARADITYFKINNGGEVLKFATSHFKIDSLFYSSKSEKRFENIHTLNINDKVCVKYSVKYLEEDESLNFKQVPLLISIQ